jgi:hypothetical protein
MIFTINNITVHSEDDCVITFSDLDKEDGTGRTETGVAFRELIREGVRTMNLVWSGLNQTETSKIIKAMKATQGFIDVTYLDPEDGVATRKFYHGDIRCQLNVGNDENNANWTIDVQLVEQ